MFTTLVSSPWINSWAPGRGIEVIPEGVGIKFKTDKQLVLQVHYSPLNSRDGTFQTDQSKIILESVGKSGSKILPLNVELFPAPLNLYVRQE